MNSSSFTHIMKTMNVVAFNQFQGPRSHLNKQNYSPYLFCLDECELIRSCANISKFAHDLWPTGSQLALILYL